MLTFVNVSNVSKCCVSNLTVVCNNYICLSDKIGNNFKIQK